MEIIFLTLVLVIGGLVWLALVSLGLGCYYLFGRMIFKGVRQAMLRPGTAQIAAYEIVTPNLKECDAEDARPMIRLELDCERHGQHFRLDLGPLTCEELFAALDQPVHRAACWMTDDDWHPLLHERWITVGCDLKRAEAILASQVRVNRERLIAAIIALTAIIMTALVQV